MKDIPVVETERLLPSASCISQADAEVMRYISSGEKMRDGDAELLGQPVEVYVHQE